MSLSLFLLVVVSFCTDFTGADVNQAPDRHNKPNIIKVPMQQAVPNGFTAFPIPPFSVEFRTLNTLTGNPEVDAALLQSEMASPLKQIVGKFVKDSFEIEVAKLAAAEDSSFVPEIILNFVSLDFQVTIQHRFSQDSVRRRMEVTGNYEEDGIWFLDFYSEFQGQAFFITPTDPDAIIPTTQQMHDLMLGWMNHNFEDLSALSSGFRMSQVEILTNIESLSIDTDIEVGTIAEFGDDDSNDDNGVEEEKTWGQAVLTTFMIFIVLAMIVVGALLFRYSLPYIVPYFQDHSVDATHSSHHQGPLATVFPPKAVDHERPMSPHRNNLAGTDQNRDLPLPGRRGDVDEELMLQQESDRWLQEHRPDLYDAVQKSQQKTQDPSETSSSQRSMPMQFLLGGMFKSQSPASPSPNPQTRRESDFSEGQDSEVSFQETIEDGSPNWWNKVLQGLKGHKLACDEDPSHYKFPFQDFPRHDGTPCLIYSETPDGLVRVVRSDSNISSHGRPLSPSNAHALSNEEFKRVLSLNSEEGVFVEEPSIEEEEDVEDEIVFQTAPVSNQSPEFTEKLNRLVTMRHRHYERQNILNKHKKTREHRVQEEARQRELKLRRHEMELDMNEIEAQYTRPRSDVGVNISSIGLNRSQSGSNSPTNGDRDVAVIGVLPATTVEGTKRSSLHRASASNPDFFIAGSSKGTGFRVGTPGSLGDINSIMETPDISTSSTSPNGVLVRKSPPRPDAPKPPSPTSVVSSKTIQKAKLGRRTSHRRWASHGVDASVDIKKSSSVDCLDRDNRDISRRNHSNEDVMTFGIAAYTDFV